MSEIKLVIGNKNGKSYSKTINDNSSLLGRKIGENVKGDLFELSGYELEITGGSDSSGFPMRQEINVTGKKKIYARSGIGIKPKFKGNYIRKTVAGNTIGERTAQVNLMVTKPGKKLLEEIFKKAEPKAE